MSESAGSTRRSRASKLPFILALVVLGVAAVMFYQSAVRERPPRELKLALVTWTEDPFWEPLIRGAQECAAQSNVKLTVVRSKPTVDAQNEHIRGMLAAGLDGIAVSPNDPAAQGQVLNETASKMPLVTFDSDAPESKRRRFVGIDNYAAGHMVADEIREALPDGGRILISVGSATMPHGRARRQGVIDGLLDRGFNRERAADPLDAELKGSKYSVAATVTDGGDPQKAKATIADALRANPDVKGVVGLFSYSAPAALAAMDQVGKADVKVVGFDESEETQAAIEAGRVHSSVLQDSYRCGYEIIQVLADEVRGIERGPAEQSPILNVGLNVLRADNLALLRDSKAIRQPAASSSSSATTKPSAS